MNTTVPPPTTRRKPALWKQAAGRPIASPPPEGGMISRLPRWLRALLPAPAPRDRTPDVTSAASIDSRELSPWRPFSPRF